MEQALVDLCISLNDWIEFYRNREIITYLFCEIKRSKESIKILPIY